MSRGEGPSSTTRPPPPLSPPPSPPPPPDSLEFSLPMFPRFSLAQMILTGLEKSATKETTKSVREKKMEEEEAPFWIFFLCFLWMVASPWTLLGVVLTVISVGAAALLFVYLCFLVKGGGRMPLIVLFGCLARCARCKRLIWSRRKGTTLRECGHPVHKECAESEGGCLGCDNVRERKRREEEERRRREEERAQEEKLLAQERTEEEKMAKEREARERERSEWVQKALECE